MKPIRFVWFAVLLGASLLSGCALHGQGSDPASLLDGKWTLDKSFGVTPPQNFSTQVERANNQVTIRSHWDEPANGQYGLTLMGLTTPQFIVDTSGREQAAQVGPYVFHYKSAWENGKLVTHWTTSEFMGSSFHGTWTRGVSKDGSTQTLDIDASSSLQMSRARLIFRRSWL
jgi:hypothetical protein